MTYSSLDWCFFSVPFGNMKQFTDESLLQAIARVSKEYRREKGITQENVNNDIKEIYKVAFHLGRIETGTNNVSISTLALLCKYYGVTLADFFGRVDKVL